jgi:hypothetical protein
MLARPDEGSMKAAPPRHPSCALGAPRPVPPGVGTRAPRTPAACTAPRCVALGTEPRTGRCWRAGAGGRGATRRPDPPGTDRRAGAHRGTGQAGPARPPGTPRTPASWRAGPCDPPVQACTRGGVSHRETPIALLLPAARNQASASAQPPPPCAPTPGGRRRQAPTGAR